MDERSDESLVAASRTGDEGARAALVRRHLKRVFAICLALLGNQDDAEDASQEVIVSALERLDTVRDGGLFGGWMAQIARNRCRDLLRRRARRSETPLTDEVVTPVPADSREEHADLLEALERLPEVHRLPLLLFYFDGRSVRKLAEELGLTEGGACVRLYRARQALRRLLAEREEAGHA